MVISTLLIYVTLFLAVSAVTKLQELFSWNVLDWAYPDGDSRNLAIQVESLIPENAIPIGIEKWKNKLFVTVPRWIGGVPATLNYISLDAPYEPSPKLIPYPSFEGNELGNCETGLNTVYRIKADKCDRLWVLDVGIFGYGSNITDVCPFTLFVYDLNTDQRIRKYVFQSEDIAPTTLVTNIALDIGTSCTDAYAYFSDELGYGLIVYSWEKNKSWRFTHSYFMPDPLLGNYNISGLVFHWGNEGIFGITLSPVDEDGYRTLYFSPLSSHTEFSVSTQILRNESNVKNSFKDFEIVGVRGACGHISAKVMDDCGVQLFNLVDQNAVGCWSAFSPYQSGKLGIVDKDDINLIFPSDIKIDDDKNVWVLSNRMPLFVESFLDYSDINFRIFTAPLNTLLEGTICEPPVQVFSNLAPLEIKSSSHSDRRPKSLPDLPQKPKIPVVMHNPQLYNTSHILNFSIVVSSKTIHYVGTPKPETPTKKVKAATNGTTSKMIIFANSPDSNDISPIYNNAYIYPKRTKHSQQMKRYLNGPTTIVYAAQSSTRNIHFKHTTASPKSYGKENILHSRFEIEDHRNPANNIKAKTTEAINSNKKYLKNSTSEKINQNFYFNLPTTLITSYETKFNVNQTKIALNTVNYINWDTTPIYDDEDYQNATVLNVAPTVINYGNELWYVKNISNYFMRVNMNTIKPFIEDDYSYTDPSMKVNSYKINNKHTSKKPQTYQFILSNNTGGNLDKNIAILNKTSKKKPHDTTHSFSRREEPKNNHNPSSAKGNSISPTAFPQKINLINTKQHHDTKKINFKPFKPASSLNKKITNTANLYESIDYLVASPKSIKTSNYNVKVNVLYYPTTTKQNSIKVYPRTFKMVHKSDTGIQEFFDK